jgi:hypothetical protein
MIPIKSTEYKNNWPNSIYDASGRMHLPYGWAGELTYTNVTNFAQHEALYREMVKHINTLVRNPVQNVLWTKLGDSICVCFRKKQDLMWFKLRFGV